MGADIVASLAQDCAQAAWPVVIAPYHVAVAPQIAENGSRGLKRIARRAAMPPSSIGRKRKGEPVIALGRENWLRLSAH